MRVFALQAQAQFAETTAPMPAITEGTYQPQVAAAGMPSASECFSEFYHCVVLQTGLQSGGSSRTQPEASCLLWSVCTLTSLCGVPGVCSSEHVQFFGCVALGEDEARLLRREEELWGSLGPSTPNTGSDYSLSGFHAVCLTECL